MRFLEHAARPDVPAATAFALGLLKEGVPFRDIVLGLLAPAQAEVGRRWASREWSVVEEHLATSVTESVLAVVAIAGVQAPSDESGHLVAACAEGDWHSLPARMGAELFRIEGWQVTFLGPSTPAEQVGRFLHAARPDALVLTCSIPMFLPGAQRVCTEAREVGVPVLAGGRGFGIDQRWALAVGASAWAPNVAEANTILLAWADGASSPSALPSPASSESLLLEATIEETADIAMGYLLSRLPQARSYDSRQLARTREDLVYTLLFAVAAVLVDDASLLLAYANWLVALLEVRGVPLHAVTVSFEALASALGPELPVSRAFLEHSAQQLALSRRLEL